MIWSGKFHTDLEDGAEEELEDLRSVMAKFWPEVEMSIAWDWITQTEEWFNRRHKEATWPSSP